MKNANKTITVSAPGKLLLMGDHAVVYGYPCIVAAIDARMYATVSLLDEQFLLINAPDVSLCDYRVHLSDLKNTAAPKGARFIEAAVSRFIRSYPIEGGISVVTRSDFSSEYGFGSSSASVVSVLFGLFQLFGKPCQAQELFEMAYKTVLDVQSVGSGADVAAAVWGGTLYFTGGGGTIEQLTLPTIPLVVGYTGVKANTSELVEMVAKKQSLESVKVNRIFAAIRDLVDSGKTHMIESNWERVGTLMNFNQEYLRDLGVSSQKLEVLISAAKKAGAKGAKLSGAGGGDCMIAVVDEETVEAVKHAITQNNGTVLSVSFCAPGVQSETTDNQEELLIVVNDADEILAYKSRAQCHADPTLLHRTVGVILTNDSGEILLQKRSMTKDMDAGLWGISAAGHVTMGQTDEDAAHRELLEEVGVDTTLTFLGTILLKSTQESERAALYSGVHNGPFSLHPTEVDEVVYMHPNQIRIAVKNGSMLFTDGALRALQLTGVLP